MAYSIFMSLKGKRTWLGCARTQEELTKFRGELREDLAAEGIPHNLLEIRAATPEELARFEAEISDPTD